MSDEKSRKELLDEFWDISSLVPERKRIRPSFKSTETVEISDGESAPDNVRNSLSESTLIQRFIPPHSASELTPKKQEIFSYVPENSLIHKVTLYKEKTDYDFYSRFCQTAKRLWSAEGRECEYADFFSYSPQYDQLSREQLEYYLWWRQCLREGRYIKTNLSYIYLYTFELINCADSSNAEECRDMMVLVLENYEDVIRGASPRYIRWISDFSLIHSLKPPARFSEKLLKGAGTFKEYFVRIPANVPEAWASTLLCYCCSYDYRTSKFATAENIALFDKHVRGALCEVVKKLSEDGRILSGLPFGDCSITAAAFEGAVCSSANRYTIVAEYCSFSRSHELRFLVGDAVKYAENKIRSHIGVKSRLTVYSLPNDIREVIDAYFSAALPAVRRTAAKKNVREEYDVLYELPQKKLDISNAHKIETESWSTTKDLVEAFDGQEILPMEETVPELTVNAVADTGEVTLATGLGEYYPLVVALKDGSNAPLKELANAQGKPVEAIVDAINEIAVDVIGDILVEDIDGTYTVIDDYADMLD